MRVVIEGLGEDRALRTLVNGKVAASLGRLHVPATTARVQFANETSAKGGPAARCSITVDLPRRPELHANSRPRAPAARSGNFRTAVGRSVPCA